MIRRNGFLESFGCDMPGAFFFLLLVVSVVARPPLTKDELDSLQSHDLEYVDEAIAPWIANSTKFKENLMYEKKKYLSTVLGLNTKVYLS